MFKHLLITRFNLRNKEWSTDKKNVEVLTEEWHVERFKLFKDFCFSTVALQTNNNFEWLVFFDTTTTEKFRTIIKELEIELSLFKPIFVDGMDNFYPEILKYASKISEPYIISSRIDNDDGLSKDYIAEVQSHFNKQDFCAVDFVDGYTLQVQPDVKLGRRLDQYNPFISLIEKNENPKTVWSVMRHSHWKREKNIIQVRNKRVWLAIIHLANKVNRFDGYGEVDITSFLEKFSLPNRRVDQIKKNVIPVDQWQAESDDNKKRSQWNYFFKTFKRRLGVYNFK